MSFSMVEQLAVSIVRADRSMIENLSRALSMGGTGLSDDAAHLALCVLQARRHAPAPARRGSLGFRIAEPRSPDRARSVARRRACATSGAVPSKIAASFTTSECAVLATIAGQVRKHGACTLCNDALAALAGTSKSVVKRTLRLAKLLGLVRVQERRRRGARNLSNVVMIACPFWRAWLKLDRGPKADGHVNQYSKTFQGAENRSALGSARKGGGEVTPLAAAIGRFEASVRARSAT